MWTIELHRRPNVTSYDTTEPRNEFMSIHTYLSLLLSLVLAGLPLTAARAKTPATKKG